MDRDQERFLKSIANSVMRSAINTTMWRLPLFVTIIIGVVAFALIYFKVI